MLNFTLRKLLGMIPMLLIITFLIYFILAIIIISTLNFYFLFISFYNL